LYICYEPKQNIMNTEFKGTKGEWRVADFSHGQSILCGTKIIANPFSNTANAKLIASAPELLSALKSCVMSMRAHPDCTEDSEFEGFVNKGIEAINKALK